MLLCGVVAYALSVAPRLRGQSADTTPGFLGGVVLACNGDFNLGRIPWLDRAARTGAIPYYAAISADGREIVSTFGPAPAVLGRAAFIGLEPGQRVEDLNLRTRARHAAAAALAVATSCLALALLAWTSVGWAAAGALVAATSFAGAAGPGQGLWQQTAALPFLAASLAALAWSERSRAATIVAPAAAIVAALIRPADAFLSIAIVACWVLVAYRRRSLPEIAGASLLAACAAGPLLVWNLVHLGTALPNGQWVRNLAIATHESVFSLAPNRIGVGLLGLSFSPARSWLLFAPIAVVGLVLAVRRASSPHEIRVRRVLVCGVFAQVLLSASFFRWWGGYAFGPRLLAGATWVGVLLACAAVPTIGRRARGFVAACAVVTSAVGMAGLFGYEIAQWDLRYEIDKHPEKLWQVSDGPLRWLFTDPQMHAPPSTPIFCPEGPAGRWAVESTPKP